MKEKWKIISKPLLIIFLIYLVGISAILLAGVHYADDAARTNYGYAGWSAFSRYASTVLSHGLHADNYLTNIAPLPQILATLILSVSSVILIMVVSGLEAFKEKWTRWIWKVVAVVPLGLCPYMLECLSYQYDAVYMALSVFFAVMPLIFYRRKTWQFVVAMVVGVLGICTTYQAAIGILPMLVIFVAMKDWNARQVKVSEIWKKLGIAAAVFLVTLLIFQKFLMTTRDVYVSNELPGLSEFFPSLFAHLGHYFELLFADFKIWWLVLIVIMMILFVLIFAMRSKQKKYWAIVVGIVGLALMTLMTYVFYAALDKPLYTTRAMYAVGVLIAIVGVYMASDKLIFVTPVVILSWCFLGFSFTYGNALAEQNAYRNRVVTMAADDVNEILPSLGGDVYIQVAGQIDFAPAVKHMPSPDFDLVRRLLKPSFGGDVYWMAYGLTEASGIPGLKFDPSVDLVSADLPMLKETALYNIYGENNGLLVEFKGESFQETVRE